MTSDTLSLISMLWTFCSYPSVAMAVCSLSSCIDSLVIFSCSRLISRSTSTSPFSITCTSHLSPTVCIVHPGGVSFPSTMWTLKEQANDKTGYSLQHKQCVTKTSQGSILSLTDMHIHTTLMLVTMQRSLKHYIYQAFQTQQMLVKVNNLWTQWDRVEPWDHS